MGVTGAPGNVGTPLVHELLARGARVRVLARRPDAAREVFGEQPGLEYGALEFGKRPTYVAAFQGLDRLFVVRPPQLSTVARDMLPALDVALGAGVGHMTLLSLQGAERQPWVPHAKLEAYLRQSGVAWTFLRPSFFLQNLSTTHLPELRGGEVFVPAGRGRTSFIDVRDIAAVAALVLTSGGHAGQAYELTGAGALTYAQVAQTLSAATGRPIRYSDPSPLAFYRRLRARGVPASQLLVMVAIYAVARLGLASRVSPDTARLLGRPPLSVADFARHIAPLLFQESPHA
ncbi:NAD(P)-dependent oxidoreductase [Deinococcus koreensis]|uniref:NAD(P)-dependent oxidoreductase n=1 Tax=Deinococcus koreensis TaxID=2054903 RepID=A0A2K3V2W8_9DEIO|nr:NAD(P)-dependent oxidoreductase [Deinococcus koreensis]